MPDPLSQPDPFAPPAKKSAFLSFLDWIDRPGQVVRNTLSGNFEGAGHQLEDFFGDAVDSVLPFDMIEQQSRPEDYVSGGDLVGLHDPGWLKTAADVGVGALTDPLTFLGFGMTGTAAKAAREAAVAGKAGMELETAAKAASDAAGKGFRFGIPFTDVSTPVMAADKTLDPLALAGQGLGKVKSMLPEGAQSTLDQWGRNVRSTIGAARNSLPYTRPLIDAGTAAEQKLAAAGTEEVRGIFNGSNSKSRQAMFDAIQNIEDDAGGRVKQIADDAPIAAPYATGSVFTGDLDPHAGMDQYAFMRKEAFDGTPPVREWDIDPVSKMLGTVGPEAPPFAGAREISQTDLLNAKLMDPMAWERLPVDKLTPANLPKTSATTDTLEGQLARIRNRLETMDLDDATREQAMAMYERFAPYAQRQFREAQDMGMYFKTPGEDTLARVPRDYMQRNFSGFITSEEDAMRGGANSIKERVLPSGQSVADLLNNAPNVSLERDAAKAAMNRVNSHAQMGKSNVIGQGLIDETLPRAKAKLVSNDNPFDSKLSPTDYATGTPLKEYGPAALTDAEKAALAADGKTMADPEWSTAVNKIIEDIAPHAPEDARNLADQFRGLPPRGPITGALAKLNRYFKPAVTMGVILPRMAFSIRNVVNGQGQILANAEAAGQFGTMAKRIVPNILGAIDDGIETLFGKRISPDVFAEYKDALRTGGGTVDGVMSKLKNPRLREAYDHGILENNFVTAEQMAAGVEREGWRGMLGKWRDMPAAIAKGSEQRMRYALFDSLRSAGHSAEDAARIVSDTLFNYSHSSTLNRAARDWVPFFQWTGKAVPSQAKWLSKNPVAGTTLAGLYAQDPMDPVTPWLQEQARIGLGPDEDGNQSYLSGLGIPAETLGQVPNVLGASSLGDLGREFERTVVASASPAVKAAYSTVSGRDPFFGSDAFGYSKVPALGDLGDVGRAYNYLADTGVTAPVDSALRIIDNLIDSRHSLPERAIETLMGAKVSDVDPDRALQQQLAQFLDRNPDVASTRSLYSRSKDPETVDLIRRMNAAKKRLADKRKAAAQ